MSTINNLRKQLLNKTITLEDYHKIRQSDTKWDKVKHDKVIKNKIKWYKMRQSDEWNMTKNETK